MLDARTRVRQRSGRDRRRPWRNLGGTQEQRAPHGERRVSPKPTGSKPTCAATSSALPARSRAVRPGPPDVTSWLKHRASRALAIGAAAGIALGCDSAEFDRQFGQETPGEHAAAKLATELTPGTPLDEATRVLRRNELPFQVDSGPPVRISSVPRDSSGRGRAPAQDVAFEFCFGPDQRLYHAALHWGTSLAADSGRAGRPAPAAADSKHCGQ